MTCVVPWDIIKNENTLQLAVKRSKISSKLIFATYYKKIKLHPSIQLWEIECFVETHLLQAVCDTPRSRVLYGLCVLIKDIGQYISHMCGPSVVHYDHTTEPKKISALWGSSCEDDWLLSERAVNTVPCAFTRERHHLYIWGRVRDLGV